MIDEETLTFEVWNKGHMGKSTAKQIFNRNFTTKESHGFGTSSMKLLEEEFLGGKIQFESKEETGTSFKFSIPLDRVG